MNHELIKRKIIHLAEKRHHDMSDFTEEKFVDVRIYENDTVSNDLSFDELGKLLIDIEKESDNTFKVIDTLGIERLKLDPSEIVLLSDVSGDVVNKYAEIRYYEVSCCLPIIFPTRTTTEKKFVFNFKNNNTLILFRNGKKVSHTFLEGVPLDILRTLIDKGVMSANDLANGKWDADYVRKGVASLRKAIEKHFDGISGKDFIPDNKNKDGYKFGDNITVIQN